MTNRPSRSKRAKQSILDGDIYEDYLRGVAKASTLPPTIPGQSCPPFTLPLAACPESADAPPAAGFPTIPLKHCIRTIPGLNCPVDTIPVIECLPDEAARVTVPIIGCPKTIPGVTCPIQTIPILECLPEHAEAEMGAVPTYIPTVLPPCPTIPGLGCPVPTIPIRGCVPPEGGGRTLPVVGCPPTIPGVTCPLPTIPVLGCLPHLAAPQPAGAADAARAAVADPVAHLDALQALPHTLIGPRCQSVLVHCPTLVPHLCPTRTPWTCRTFDRPWCPPTGVPPFCYLEPEPGLPEPRTFGAAVDLGGFPPFPTLPIERCIKTIPGISCPIRTIPIAECVPIETIPVVGCPKTIPGISCQIETIPLIDCISGDEGLGDPIRTLVPVCPTIPGVSCPIKTVPIWTCLPGPEALADAKKGEVEAAATLPVLGCPPTIPGVTCDLPTVPVVECLGGGGVVVAPTAVGPRCPPPTSPPGCAWPTHQPGCAVPTFAPPCRPSWLPGLCPPVTVPIAACDPATPHGVMAAAVPAPSIHHPCPTPPVTQVIQCHPSWVDACPTRVPWQCESIDVMACRPTLDSPDCRRTLMPPCFTVPVVICDPAGPAAAFDWSGASQAMRAAPTNPPGCRVAGTAAPTYPPGCAAAGAALPGAAGGYVAYPPTVPQFACRTFVPWMCFTRSPAECLTQVPHLCPTEGWPCKTWICAPGQPQGFLTAEATTARLVADLTADPVRVRTYPGWSCRTIGPLLCPTVYPETCHTVVPHLCPSVAHPCQTWICDPRQPQGF